MGLNDIRKRFNAIAFFWKNDEMFFTYLVPNFVSPNFVKYSQGLYMLKLQIMGGAQIHPQEHQATGNGTMMSIGRGKASDCYKRLYFADKVTADDATRSVDGSPFYMGQTLKICGEA